MTLSLNISWLMAVWSGSISMARQKNEPANAAEGKSSGGLSTKIHAAVDAWGHPVRFIVTQGQSSEYDQAASLIAGFKADIVLADPGYDANRLIALIRA